MLKRNKLVRLALGLVLLSVLVSGCAPAATPTPQIVKETQVVKETQIVKETQVVMVTPTPAPPTDVIKIGYQGSLTGVGAYTCINIAMGMKVAAEEINEAGGVLGYSIEIVPLDDAGDPSQAAASAHLLCDDPLVVAADSACMSGEIIPSEPIYDACRMPVVTLNSNPQVTELGYDNVFQYGLNDTMVPLGLADYLYEVKGFRTIAIAHDKRMWGEGVANNFKKRCEDLGMTVTSFQGIDPESTDFSPLITKIMAEDPEVFYYGGRTEGALIVRQMKELGAPQFFAGGELTSAEWVAAAGDAAIGALTSTVAPHRELNAKVTAYWDSFTEKYGVEPEPWTIYYYDGVYMLKEAIERAGSIDREAIIEALRDTDYDGVIQRYQFRPDGKVVEGSVFVYEMQDDGQFHFIDQLKFGYD